MFKEIDYKNMPEDRFKHLYIESILNKNSVWGCVPEPAFNRVCKNLSELGFKKIEIEQVINDPETVQTFVISSTKDV